MCLSHKVLELHYMFGTLTHTEPFCIIYQNFRFVEGEDYGSKCAV
jgi:hypothetical protein